jgi:hypothetical protein
MYIFTKVLFIFIKLTFSLQVFSLYHPPFMKLMYMCCDYEPYHLNVLIIDLLPKSILPDNLGITFTNDTHTMKTIVDSFTISSSSR